MPIDFTCSGCANQLRVSDESAGKDARCPQCGAINRVPAAAASPYSTLGAPAPMPEKKDWLFNEAGNAPAMNNPFGAAATNPYAAPQANAYALAGPSLPIVPAVVAVEPILNHAWRIWQDNLGLLVGVAAATFGISMVLGFVFGFAQAIVLHQADQEVRVVANLGVRLILQAVQLYLGIGQAQIALKLARRQPAEFTDLFGGAPFFVPVLLSTLLASVALFLGLLALIVPFFLLLLMFWPYYYLIVDGKAGIIESFSVAQTITKGNWGTAILLWLLSMAIMFLGLLALCVGVIFAAPLVSVLFATAYLMMAGQLPVYSQPTQYPAYGKP